MSPILKSRRFLPLFVTQFLGAFNDNLFKNALVMLITFRLASETSMAPQLLVTLAAGIFILPFFLFSATAGQIAEKMDKAYMARLVKLAEIAFMAIAMWGFMLPSIPLLMVVLFGMGAHSAFFGPIKYSILPQHLAQEELLAGNAYVEAATFLAILLGTILAGVLVMHPDGAFFTSISIVVIALAGYGFSRFIPAAPGAMPDLKVNPRFWQETARLMVLIREDAAVYRAILAVSWFWFIGAVYLTQFPVFAKEYLGGDESVVTLLLTLFSVGIAAGSVFCNRLLGGLVQVTYVPIAAFGMAIFGIHLFFAVGNIAVVPGALISAASFIAVPAHWAVMFDLFMISVFGGLFVVPLYAYIQKHSAPKILSRTIAGLNVMNALFMVASSLLTVLMLKLSMTIPQVFLIVAALNLLVAIYIAQLLPHDLMRSIARSILGWAYRVEVKGIENFEAAGKRVLIVANHTSFLDAALIAAYLPVKVTFAVNTHIARQWWLKPFLTLVDAFPLDPTNPLAIRALIDVVKQDKTAMIFPEGRITVTGALMKIYEGPGVIADKSEAMVLPIRIDGAQYSPFSRLRGRVRIRSFPKITLTIMPPRHFALPKDMLGRKRRQKAAAELYNIMSDMVFRASDTQQTLFASLLDARSLHGPGHVIAEDPLRQAVDYRTLVSRALALGSTLRRLLPAADPQVSVPAVGVLLPNMVTTVTTFFALHAAGRTPAMLNFSSGPAQIASACSTACLKTVLTSRLFVARGKLEAVIEAIEASGATVLYLEDVKDQVGLQDKMAGLLARYAPGLVLRKGAPEDAAVILFTSGSEGTPKGVVLSHVNIQANRHQIGSRIDFGPTDIVFNCLPMFHSFGLTGGTLLPVLAGIRSFYYPSPLHYRIVPELVYDTNATILFGTDTFLSGYARFANPYDFHAIRYVFAGAEKLKEETRKVYADKYGVRIFEGYGATETAPVISINTPMHNRPGSVGRLMPGVDYQLEPVEGIEGEAGKLIVKGPNIMKGYLKSDAPGVLSPPEEGWYDTGDIVRFDEDGFISIQGRLKRFAKIGGEMVSLTAVETALQKRYPDAQHAVVSVKDDKKGERLILFTTEEGATPQEVLQYFRQEGLGELSVPKTIKPIADIPLLGTGKTDYVSLQAMAAEA